MIVSMWFLMRRILAHKKDGRQVFSQPFFEIVCQLGVTGFDLAQVIYRVVSRLLVRLQRIHRVQPNALNQSNAVIRHIPGQVSVALFAL